MSFNRSFKIAFVIAFVIAFFGVAVGFERVVVDVLALAFGAAAGFGGAMTFRRWRGDFRS